jgi:hypothetical protein
LERENMKEYFGSVNTVIWQVKYWSYHSNDMEKELFLLL